MIDYNEFLSNEEKAEYLVQKIEAEREKLTKLLHDNSDLNKRLGALEEYYISLREINEKYGNAFDVYNPGDTDAY